MTMEKYQNTIDWSYKSELNKLCDQYNKAWIAMDNFYIKKRIFAYIAGITTKCKGVHQIYPKVNGVFIFDWDDYPKEYKRFTKKLKAIARKTVKIKLKMGFKDLSLGN